MGFFSRTKKRSGWLAVGVYANAVCAACVKRVPTHKPKVRLCVTFPGKRAASAVALEKVAKDLQANRYHCTSLLGSGDYQLLSLDAPNVPPQEVKNALRWRLKDMLDYPVEQATFDMLPVPTDAHAPERNPQIFLACAHNQTVAERQKIFHAADIALEAIDIPEMAQRNISALIEADGCGLALLSFDEDGGLLTVTYSGDLYLARRIDVNLQQVDMDTSEAREAAYDKITLELQRSLDHFDRQYHFISLTKLVLAPMGDFGERLYNYLATNMYLPVEWVDLTDIFDCSKVPELKDKYLQQRYFLPLGAALRTEEVVA